MCHPCSETVCQSTFLRPTMLVKTSCRLCRLVLLLQCAMPQKLRSGTRTASGTMDLKQAICWGNISRLPCTSSTYTFSPTLLSNSWRCPKHVGFARAVQFSSRIRIKEDTSSQISKVQCVFIRVHHNADGVRLRTHFHHDWNTHTRTPSSGRKVST